MINEISKKRIEYFLDRDDIESFLLLITFDVLINKEDLFELYYKMNINNKKNFVELIFNTKNPKNRDVKKIISSQILHKRFDFFNEIPEEKNIYSSNNKNFIYKA
jgi:hypothetical protein